MPLSGLYASAFQPSPATCGFASNRETKLLFAPLPSCGSEPDEYVLTTDGATALGAGTMTVFIKTINGVTAPVGSKIFLSKGRVLKFGSDLVTVSKGVDVTTLATPGTAVQIDAAPALIATETDSDILWPTANLAGVQSVSLSANDQTEENSELENFYGSMITLGRTWQAAVSMKEREANIVWKRIIYPAFADPGLNLFVVMKKAATPCIWGQFKISGAQLPGENRTAVMRSFNLDSQNFVSVPQKYPSEMATADKAIYDAVLTRAGLSTVLTQFD
jgi:hypothetical protein